VAPGHHAAVQTLDGDRILPPQEKGMTTLPPGIDLSVATHIVCVYTVAELSVNRHYADGKNRNL
jgi:hypothetical protein